MCRVKTRLTFEPRLERRRAPVPVERVCEVVHDLYDLRGSLEKLAHERDLVYHLTTGANQSYVIRISPPSEPFASLRLQCDALHAIAHRDATLPVPRVRGSRRGRDIEEIGDGKEMVHVRVLTYLSGTPMLTGPRSRAQLDVIGRTLARLDRALARAPIDPVTFPLLWDMRASPQLKPLVRFIADARHRALVEAVLDRFDKKDLRPLNALPTQVIHNDFNPKNILYDNEGGEIVGIIDFGDVVHAPRAVDLGVTIARHAELEAPLRAGESIIAGYCSVTPLSTAEIGALYSTVRTRLAMRAVIGSWRVHHDDPRGDRRQVEDALSLLEHLTRLGSRSATTCWTRSAGL